VKELSRFIHFCWHNLVNFKYVFLGCEADFPVTIQWHITDKCLNNCKHCYMSDPRTANNEKERTLNLAQKIDIVKQIDNFGKKYGFAFKHYALIGGDPLLAEDVFDLTKELVKRKKRVSFIGNPETLTDEICKKLKKLGITHFQLSLDGLEKTHDSIRGKGSFKRTIEGYELLDKYGIHATTMFTLSSLNVDDFFDLIDFVFYGTKSKGFVFDFCVRIGNAKNIIADITPETALEICNRYLNLKKLRERERPEFHFAEKPGFLRLLHLQRKEIVFNERGITNFIAGCLIGNRCECILSDGSVPVCRRLPQILGRLPEDSFEEIYLSNETLKKYRRPQFFEDCGKCIGWNWCRGCPGTSNEELGNPFKKPNTCFAHLLNINTLQEHQPVLMDTTLKEEAGLIKNNTRHEYHNLHLKRRFPSKVTKTMKKLKNPFEAKSFAENSQKWFLENAPKLNANEQDLVLFHYNLRALGFVRNNQRGPKWPT